MSKASTSNTTELHVQSGMHIESPDGVIARPPAINPETGEVPEVQESFDPRKAMMDAIVANRAESFQKELDYGIEISPQKSPEQEDADAAARDEALAVASGTKEPEEAAEAPIAKKTIVVDGQSLEFTEDELIRLAQRGMSADNRFQEAANMRQQYNDALARAQGQQYQPTAPAAGQQAVQPQSTPADDAMLKEISRRISYGSEEEQTRAVSDLINVAAKTAGRNIQVPSPDQLVNVATQNALATIRFEQNMETIGREYKDIFEDEDLTLIAAKQANKLDMKYKMLGLAKSPLEIYREAGNTVREKYLNGVSASEHVGSITTQTPIQSAQVLPMTAKVERKRVAPQPPAAANRTASDNAQSAHPSGSQIVAQMRKSRHQSAF